MNYIKYNTISCKRCFYLLICNELFCIDQENQLLIITNTMNIITILQPSNFNVFLHLDQNKLITVSISNHAKINGI